ncbi:MAG: hypothetical protein V5A64_03955 [Candidatus Thermoplasmatota archaeon]
MQSNYNKKDMEIVSNIWGDQRGEMKCPKCGGDMVLIQVEPIEDTTNPFVPYDTVIECNYCDFQVRTESYTVLGSVKNFDLRNIEIASWSPSGSRVTSEYEHIINYDLLKKLKEGGDLVEFLIVNNQAVQVIG